MLTTSICNTTLLKAIVDSYKFICFSGNNGFDIVRIRTEKYNQQSLARILHKMEVFFSPPFVSTLRSRIQWTWAPVTENHICRQTRNHKITEWTRKQSNEQLQVEIKSYVMKNGDDDDEKMEEKLRKRREIWFLWEKDTVVKLWKNGENGIQWLRWEKQSGKTNRVVREGEQRKRERQSYKRLNTYRIENEAHYATIAYCLTQNWSVHHSRCMPQAR